MNSLHELQDWYLSQCNGDWEHQNGVSIQTLDNPGWQVEIQLHDTILEGIEFKEQSYGVGEEAESSGDNWVSCKVTNNIFTGAGGPKKLEEIISVFLF